MPKIDAPTVAEHVARRERAVVDAAARLFVERGYGSVSIQEIAAAAGLRRSSLYRYFPDKAQLALRVLEGELRAREEAERAAAAADAALPPTGRASNWAKRQLAYARRPEHRLLIALGDVLQQPGPAAERARRAHEATMQPLRDALAGAADDATRAGHRAELISALVMAVSRIERNGAPPNDLYDDLHRAIRAIVTDAPAARTSADGR